MAELVMPRLSDSMEEGTIVRWLVGDGETVRPGDELLEVETDKATMVVEAEEEGPLRIVVGANETVPLGALIAHIGEAAMTTTTSVAEPDPTPTAEPTVLTLSAVEPAWPAYLKAGRGGGASASTRVVASPVARRLAADLGIDLATISGSGPIGRVTKHDVLAAEAATTASVSPAAPLVPATGEVRTEELTRIQQVVARRMAESRSTIPDFALRMEVDMDATIAVREQLRAQLREDAALPSYNDFVIKACALALTEHPRANGSYRDGAFELHGEVNVGFAVAAEGSLLVPVIRDADRQGLLAIAGQTRELATKGRDGALTAPELSGGTFTVSTLGMFGVSSFTAVINPPQAAILAVGALTPTPVVRDGEITIARMMALTLSSDHRILYGADAAEFLRRVRELLEAPLGMAF